MDIFSRYGTSKGDSAVENNNDTSITEDQAALRLAIALKREFTDTELGEFEGLKDGLLEWALNLTEYRMGELRIMLSEAGRFE